MKNMDFRTRQPGPQFVSPVTYWPLISFTNLGRRVGLGVCILIFKNDSDNSSPNSQVLGIEWNPAG